VGGKWGGDSKHRAGENVDGQQNEVAFTPRGESLLSLQWRFYSLCCYRSWHLQVFVPVTVVEISRLQSCRTQVEISRLQCTGLLYTKKGGLSNRFDARSTRRPGDNSTGGVLEQQ